MKNEKVKCHICGKTIKGDDILRLCTVCGADLGNPNEEQVYQVQYSTHVSSTQNFGNGFSGFMRLTNKRLFWCADSAGGHAGAYSFGLVGALVTEVANKAVVSKSSDDKKLVSIPLVDIQAIESGKDLIIHTTAGVIHKFSCPKKNYATWMNEIQRLASFVVPRQDSQATPIIVMPPQEKIKTGKGKRIAFLVLTIFFGLLTLEGLVMMIALSPFCIIMVAMFGVPCWLFLRQYLKLKKQYKESQMNTKGQ